MSTDYKEQITSLNRFTEEASRTSRRDVFRNVPLVRVGIECATKGLVEAGYVIPLGYSEAVIYEDEVSKLQGLVENEMPEIEKANQFVDEEHGEFEKAGKSHELREYANWAATFRIRNRREPKPLRSVKVIEKMDAPKSEDEKKMLAQSNQFIDAVNKLFQMQAAATAKATK